MWFVRALSMGAMGFQAPSLRQKHQAWVVDHVSFWEPREPPGEGWVRHTGSDPLSAAVTGHLLPAAQSTQVGSEKKALLRDKGIPRPMPAPHAHIFLPHLPSLLLGDSHLVLAAPASTCDVHIVVQSHQGKAPFVVIREVRQSHPLP